MAPECESQSKSSQNRSWTTNLLALPLAIGVIFAGGLPGGVQRAEAQIIAFDSFEQHLITGIADGATMYGLGSPNPPVSNPPNGGWAGNWSNRTGVADSSNSGTTNPHPSSRVTLRHTTGVGGLPQPLEVVLANSATLSGSLRAMSINGSSSPAISNRTMIKRPITTANGSGVNVGRPTGSRIWMSSLVRVGDVPAANHEMWIMLASNNSPINWHIDDNNDYDTSTFPTNGFNNTPRFGIRNGQFAAAVTNTQSQMAIVDPTEHFAPEAGQDYWMVASFQWNQTSSTPAPSGTGHYSDPQLWVLRNGSPGLSQIQPMAVGSGGQSRVFQQINFFIYTINANANCLRIGTSNIGTTTYLLDNIVIGNSLGDIVGGPDTPLRVDLVSFTATATGVGSPVTINWETSAEFDNAGFNLFRAADNGPGQKLNAFPIPAEGTETEGSTYSFVDSAPLAHDEVRGYYLEDVEFGGKKTLHGPVRVGPFTGSRSSVADWSQYD